MSDLEPMLVAKSKRAKSDLKSTLLRGLILALVLLSVTGLFKKPTPSEPVLDSYEVLSLRESLASTLKIAQAWSADASLIRVSIWVAFGETQEPQISFDFQSIQQKSIYSVTYQGIETGLELQTQEFNQADNFLKRSDLSLQGIEMDSLEAFSIIHEGWGGDFASENSYRFFPGVLLILEPNVEGAQWRALYSTNTFGGLPGLTVTIDAITGRLLSLDDY